MDYEALRKDYKDTLESLLSDFEDAYELRKAGEQSNMYFTLGELKFMVELLRKQGDEFDGRF